jgi:hypothetical protein
MCWSAEVSLETFLFSGGICILAFLNGFPMKYLILYFCFFLMQLIEFFLWKNLKDPVWNRFFSYMVFILLAIQPLAISLIISDFTVRLLFIGLYIIYIILTLYVFFNTNEDIYSVSVAKNKHLSWNWVENYVHVYCIYLLFFVGLLIEKEYTMFLILFGTYGYSIINFYKERTFSTIWCWSSNIIGFYILIRIYIFPLIYGNKK